MNALTRLYDTFFYDALRGMHDFGSGTVKMALLGASYTPCAVYGARDGAVTYATGAVIYSPEYNCFFVAGQGGMTSLGAPAFDPTPGAQTADKNVVWVSAGLAPPSTHTVFADVSASEITASGYTAGGQTVAAGVSLTGRAMRLDVPAVKWPESAISAKYAVVYRSGVYGGVTDPLVAYILLDSTGGLAESTSGTFIVSFGGDAICTVGGWPV